jgi:hypothetical protein
MVMRNENQGRRRAAIQLEHEVHDVAARAAVQIACRLIGKQHGRLGGERPRNRDALFFTARQLRRIVPPAVVEPDFVDNSERRLACIIRTRQLERQHDVFQRV